jgi:hypothetical protein
VSVGVVGGWPPEVAVLQPVAVAFEGDDVVERRVRADIDPQVVTSTPSCGSPMR